MSFVILSDWFCRLPIKDLGILCVDDKEYILTKDLYTDNWPVSLWLVWQSRRTGSLSRYWGWRDGYEMTCHHIMASSEYRMSTRRENGSYSILKNWGHLARYPQIIHTTNVSSVGLAIKEVANGSLSIAKRMAWASGWGVTLTIEQWYFWGYSSRLPVVVASALSVRWSSKTVDKQLHFRGNQ
jgi:hypothetical protein